MSLYRSYTAIVTFVCVLALCMPMDADAAKKKKKGNKKKPEVTFVGSVQFKTGKGKKQKDNVVEVSCAGKRSFQSKGKKLISIASRRSAAGREVKRLGGKKRAPKKLLNRLQYLVRLSKAAKDFCASASENNDTIGPVDLTPFKGTFGAREARILGERFAVSFTRAEVQRAVSEGLDATIARMQSYNQNSRLLALPGQPLVRDVYNDLKCDGYMKLELGPKWNDETRSIRDHPNEKDCNETNPNDRNIQGVRSWLYLEALGENPYFAQLIGWLSDDRVAPTFAFASSETRYHYLAEAYLEDLRAVAISGDYDDYIRRIFLPDVGSGYAWIVLNGVENNDPTNPNQDGTREAWELGTLGAEDLSGNLLYNPFDIAQASLANTGYIWGSIYRDVGEEDLEELRVASFSPDAHAEGEFIIFGEDPANRTTSSSLSQTIEASLAHSNTPIELARRICGQYIAENCSPKTVIDISKRVKSFDKNLHKILAWLARTNAPYEERTREALFKQPWEHILGFLRAMEFPVLKEPVTMRQIESRLLDRTGYRAFLPPTIFGFDEQQLSSEPRILERRGACLDGIGSWGSSSLDEFWGYDIGRFYEGSQTTEEAVRRLADAVNVELSAEQLSNAVLFLDNYVDQDCSSGDIKAGNCDSSQEGEEYIRRDRFDPDSSAYKWRDRYAGLAVIFCQTPQSYTK